MRQALLLLATLAIAGCANDAAQKPDVVATAAPAGDVKQVCTRERRVGSEIPVTVCGPAMTEEERRAQMNEIANQIRVQTPQHAAGQ